MAKEKVTITLDRAKAKHARALLAARSISETIDLALDHLIDAERLRRDIAAYRRIPPTAPETAITLLADPSGLADATDWEGVAGDAGSLPVPRAWRKTWTGDPQPD